MDKGTNFPEVNETGTDLELRDVLIRNYVCIDFWHLVNKVRTVKEPLWDVVNENHDMFIVLFQEEKYQVGIGMILVMFQSVDLMKV